MKLSHCWSLSFAFLALATGTFAHPLDVYLQATLVAIEPNEIRLEMNLTPGVQVADQVLGLIDRNRDGVIATNEAAAYAALLEGELVVRLDGRIVETKLAALDFPETGELRTGWGIIQLEFSVNPGSLAPGPHKLTLENRHNPVASAYLFNAARPASASIQVTGQKRNENQSTGEITFVYHPASNPIPKFSLAVCLPAIFVVLSVGLLQAKRRRRDVL
jgi:hypothetical protein